MPGPLDRVLGALRGAQADEKSVSAADAEAPPAGARPDRRLAEALSEGVLWVDRAGRIRGANAAACRLLGSPYPPGDGEPLGQTLLEATHSRAIAELNAQALAGGALREIETRTLGPVERTLRVRSVPLPEGEEAASLLVLEDLTELLRLRTVRTEFVANVSHELRTPLASIRATAETLLDGAASDPQMAPRFLETILREVGRLVRLSEDLLDLSRAESTERERARFDLAALVSDVAARLGSQAEKRGVAVTVVPAPPLVIRADRDEIAQVFFNLLDNAIKYTPSGGQVTLSLVRREEAVAVTVADTGIGILSQDLPRIFERFWRADRARRFRSAETGGGTSGTGLGLSIVKHIVEAHGGDVVAESELNRGSRFTVTLPMAVDG
jgi:two-component system phosphate regulon sensor histidine kinase PhoR